MLSVYLLATRLEPVRPSKVPFEYLPEHGQAEPEEVVVEVGEGEEEAIAQCGDDGRHARVVPGVDVAVRQDDLGVRVCGD